MPQNAPVTTAMGWNLELGVIAHGLVKLNNASVRLTMVPGCPA